MLVLTAALLTAMAIMALFPQTPLARALRGWLVEGPARTLNRIALWRAVFYGGLIFAGIALTMLFEAEGALVYGFMAPEILAWAVLFDVGVLIDALLITAAVLATNGLKVARMQVAAWAGRVVGAVRTRTAARAVRSPVRRTRPGRKTDDDRPGVSAQPRYLAFSMA